MSTADVTVLDAVVEPGVDAHLQDLRRLGRWTLLLVVGGLIPLAAWVALAPLSSAVVAPAFVKVDLDRRPVQHAEGGTVLEVLVRDGQQVKRGDPLVVLGDVSVDADRNRVAYRQQVERAGLARADAEQLMAASIRFPADLLEAAQRDERLAAQLERERQLFATRRDALHRQVHLLHAQAARIGEEIGALEAQVGKAGQSLQFQRAELDTNRKLQAEGFLSATRVTQLEGSVADYGVKMEERRSELARAHQRMADARLRSTALENEYRQQASEQRRLVAARLSDIEQELRKLTDASERQVIRAPVDGAVMGLRVTAAGAVIPPREPIADIVPVDTRLVTEARIRPEDIERVALRQPADIRLTAYRGRTTQLVQGQVTYVSPDRLVDRATNLPFYSVQVEIDPASLVAAGGLKLQAGMPAEVYLQGERRTPLQYLLEPVTDVLRRGARER